VTDSFAATLHDWETYFFLMGTAGATLVGLEFVAISLAVAALSRKHFTGISTFVTPTLLHFVYVLLLSAVILMPHLDLLALGALLAGTAVSGLAFMFPRWRELKAMGGTGGSQRSNWVWYFASPFLAHVLLLVAVPFVIAQEEWSLFALAAATLLLLVIGIRNSWDLVLWIATRRESEQ
jgi:hypothetical protein